MTSLAESLVTILTVDLLKQPLLEQTFKRIPEPEFQALLNHWAALIQGKLDKQSPWIRFTDRDDKKPSYIRIDRIFEIRDQSSYRIVSLTDGTAREVSESLNDIYDKLERCRLNCI